MQELTIGRSPDNSIIINDTTVSRRHATLIIAQNEFSIKDLGSANGTFVNGMRVAGVSSLQSNDILKVGNSVVPWMNYVKWEATTTISLNRSGSNLLVVQ